MERLINAVSQIEQLSAGLRYAQDLLLEGLSRYVARPPSQSIPQSRHHSELRQAIRTGRSWPGLALFARRARLSLGCPLKTEHSLAEFEGARELGDGEGSFPAEGRGHLATV